MNSIDELSPYLEIHSYVSLLDIRDIQERAMVWSKEDIYDQYIAYRRSDKSLHYISVSIDCNQDMRRSQVSIDLPRVFDYDIVTFSPLIRLNVLDSSEWIACMGDITKYNNGGAIRKVINHRSSEHDSAVDFCCTVIGPGTYWFVSSTKINASIDQSVGDRLSMSMGVSTVCFLNENESQSLSAYLTVITLSSLSDTKLFDDSHITINIVLD